MLKGSLMECRLWYCWIQMSKPCPSFVYEATTSIMCSVQKFYAILSFVEFSHLYCSLHLVSCRDKRYTICSWNCPWHACHCVIRRRGYLFNFANSLASSFTQCAPLSALSSSKSLQFSWLLSSSSSSGGRGVPPNPPFFNNIFVDHLYQVIKL